MAVKPTKLRVPDMGSVQAPEAAALGITWQIGVGHPDDRRSLVIQTYAARDDTPEAIKDLLSKITGASDYIERVYRLRDLRLELKKHQNELARQMETYTNLDDDYRAAWAKRGKRGDYRPEGNEISALAQNKQNQERSRAMVGHLNTEIKTLEELL